MLSDLLSILPLSSRVAFCVSPICLTSRSIASAAMEAILWRQVRQILLALDPLDRRKPQERRRHSRVNDRAELPTSDDYG